MVNRSIYGYYVPKRLWISLKKRVTGIHARKTKASTCWQGKKFLKSMAHKDIFHLLNVKKALCKVSLRDNIDILWL